MRRTVSTDPLIAPCFSRASSAYALHVGWYLQLNPTQGEKISLYARTGKAAICASGLIPDRAS